tara:strand:- start:115 stop:1521 length:1407 start_codon:yes stop_codon:yes gene_type:complete
MKFLLFGLLVSVGWLQAQSPPNVLIIMADDCTFNDLPAYGGQNAKTPHIDKLAREGLLFRRAYLSEAMCQPCRAELFSGQYPTRNGCAWNHSASRNSVTSMPHHLGPLGYRVGLAGKVHVKPKKVFPFEEIDGFDSNCVRNPTRPHQLSGISEFIRRDQKKPFCLVVALVEPHVPWVMGDASQYPPATIKLPPNIADTPRTRQDFSAYLAEITYMDGQVGEILKVLEGSGKANDTLVLFTSEQGSQFPGCKWTNWDTGIHTGLIARWPEKIEGGRTTDAVVQYADILPTLLTLAGGDCDEKPYDGRSFAGVLRGEETSHRQYAYGLHNNIPEGPRYPVRTVTDGEWRYIRNLLPEEIYIEKHLMGIKGTGALNNPYWATWVRDSWNNPHTYKVVRRYMRRPAEQLYHTAEDPYEMSNLAGTPEFSGVQKKLSMELDRWMKRQGDPGAAQDTQRAHKAAKEGKHLYGAQ